MRGTGDGPLRKECQSVGPSVIPSIRSHLNLCKVVRLTINAKVANVINLASNVNVASNGPAQRPDEAPNSVAFGPS